MKRERELLSFTKKWNIPTIVVFTYTQAEAGDAFVQETQKIINEEWGFEGFIRAYVRVNSVVYLFHGMNIPVGGLEELVDETKKCLLDAIENKKNHFLRVQKVKIQTRKQAMIEECKTIIHVASGAAGAVGLIPIPFSDALAIAPIQAGMIYKMNDAFGVDLDKTLATSLITGLLGVTAAIITEGIGFAYLKVLEKCFNDETGEVNFPEIDMITSLFKESYFSLDSIKQLKP